MNEENWKTMADTAAEYGSPVAAFLLEMHRRANTPPSPSDNDRVGRLGNLLVALGKDLQVAVIS